MNTRIVRAFLKPNGMAVLKVGAIATAGVLLADGPRSGIKFGALTAGTFALRKQIVRAAYAAAKEYPKSKSILKTGAAMYRRAIGFRRIGGRVIPIFK